MPKDLSVCVFTKLQAFDLWLLHVELINQKFLNAVVSGHGGLALAAKNHFNYLGSSGHIMDSILG